MLLSTLTRINQLLHSGLFLGDRPEILILKNFAPYRRSIVSVQGAKRSPQVTVLPPEFPS
ncbi:MAG: hypothetical protein VKL39_09395 [Leptolyngbyaceae bacterium]|nr:hypothetical protein [Leptolyngbyaceae bacterium]